jgi:hypothetical protein
MPGHRHREVVVDALVEVVQHRESVRRGQIDPRLRYGIGGRRRGESVKGHGEPRGVMEEVGL